MTTDRTITTSGLTVTLSYDDTSLYLTLPSGETWGAYAGGWQDSSKFAEDAQAILDGDWTPNEGDGWWKASDLDLQPTKIAAHYSWRNDWTTWRPEAEDVPGDGGSHARTYLGV